MSPGNARSGARSIVRWLATGAGVAAGVYGAYVATAWCRYGRPTLPPDGKVLDPLLDRYMPAFEVAERHHIHLMAPAEVTFAAAAEMDLQSSRVIRAIFTARQWIMGGEVTREAESQSFLSQMRAIGWGVLAELPGREIVMGAVTQPWEADVVFRALPPEEFVVFDEPGYVKIAWTLRADPAGPAASVFHTETRAMTTDVTARRRFRIYWACVSPGVILIRWLILGLVKEDAERRARHPGG